MLAELYHQGAELTAQGMIKAYSSTPYRFADQWYKEQKNAFVTGWNYLEKESQKIWEKNEALGILANFSYGFACGLICTAFPAVVIGFSTLVLLPEKVGLIRSILSALLLATCLALLAHIDTFLLSLIFCFFALPKFVHGFVNDINRAKSGDLSLVKMI